MLSIDGFCLIQIKNFVKQAFVVFGDTEIKLVTPIKCSFIDKNIMKKAFIEDNSEYE